MLYSVHFFIGKEFDLLLESAGTQLFRDGQDALRYNHIYRVDESSGKELLLSKLQVCDAEGKDDAASQSIQIGWTEFSSVKPADWAAAYVNEVYDKVLTASISNQMSLPVFIHFPFYKESSVKILNALCTGIRNSIRFQTTTLTFIGFGDDMVRVLEPDYVIKSPSHKQLRAFDAMRNELGLSKDSSRFVFMHNSTMKGIALGMDDTTCFVELICQLILLLSTSFEQVLPMDAHDVTAIGFSSLSFNKYKFATYLLNKAMIETIDQASVNSNDVDVNKVFDVVNGILHDKDEVLSRFFTVTGAQGDNTVHDDLKATIGEIKAKVVKVCSQTRDITFKTAILAALLSKTEYGLFSSSVYNSSNSCLHELYRQPIDCFIEEDEAGFYKIDGQRVVNPIDKIKELDRTIINSESEIRNLERRLQEQEKNIQDSDKVRDCYIEDEFFHFDDKKFRLLPNVIEEPLQETYTPKPTTVESVDLRAHFTEVKNQGQQGSCLSFTVTSVFEYMMKLNQSQECDLSEAFLYYNARNLDDAGDVSVHTDNGSRFKPAMDSLTRYGIALEKYCPYDEGVYDRRPSEDAYKDAETRKLIKALNVERNVDHIKSALAEGYPVAASFTLCESFYPGSGGYISMPTAEEIEATYALDDEQKRMKHSRHAMAIVGYSDQLQMFLVRNSWGQDWGDNGYCYIPYAYVAHENLFNFACIITEVASLKAAPQELKQVPALSVDNTDVRIRYYITKAALECELSLVEKNRKERIYWCEYFETIKALFSNSNNRDDFVKLNSGKLNADKLACETSIKDAEKKQDAIREDWLAYNKKVVLRLVVALLAAFSIWAGGNYITSKLLDLFRVSYIWMLLVMVVCVLVALVSLRIKRREWLEDRDSLDNIISKNNRNISGINKKLSELRFKAFAAWTLMRSLEEIQDYLLSYYNKMVSLINNLRVWYAELQQSNDEMDFASKFPNISLLDRGILDKYFNDSLKSSEVCAMDICENIENYEISAEFLSKFKSDFSAEIMRRLIKSLEKVDFNMSAHLVENAYDKMAKKVTPTELNALNYQANVFVHLNLQNRGDVAFSRVLFAPDLDSYRIELIQKTSAVCSMPDYLPSEDKYRMTLLAVASLFYDECVLLRGNKENDK